MSRSPSLVLACTFMITPGGWALPTHPHSMFGNFLMPMCSAWSAIETQAERFGPEIDPRSSVWLLPQWEQLLGPDPCGRDQLPLSIADQQRLVYQRLTARGGQSIPYYVAIAAAMGVTVTVKEATWSRAGLMRAGTPVAAPGEQFSWQVSLPMSRVVPFVAGGSQAGNPLGAFTANLCQCAIAQAAPAHTTVAFNYTGTI